MRRMLIVSFALGLLGPIAAAAPPTIGELIQSVPASARVVVSVDSAALRNVPRVQEWLLHHQAWTGADQDLRQFLADSGLDPVRDVDAMVVAIFDKKPGKGVVAFFSGRYDPSSLGAALVKRGAETLTLDTVPAFRLRPSSPESDGTAVLAQPSPDLVVVGDEAAVRATLASPRAVAPLVEREVAAGHIDLRAPFWVVATIPAELRDKADEAATREPGDTGEPMRGLLFASGSVERVALQVFLDDSLRLSGVAVANTPENAELLRDAVKGAIAAARLHAQGQAPELVNVLRDVQVRLSGPEVSATGSIPLTVLERLIAEHGTMHHTGQKAPER